MKNKKLKKIKLILEVIQKKIISEPKNDTFEFSYEDFIPEKSKPIFKGVTNFATETEQISLQNLFEKIQKENSGIKFIFPEPGKGQINPFGLSPLEIRELSKPTFFIYIENAIKFDKYQKRIKQQLKEKIPTLILNEEGTLYRADDKEKKAIYPMTPGGFRYKIVHYLAREKRYVQTAELATEFEKPLPQIRKTIAEIRRLIKKRLKISGDKIIESNPGSGYRIKNIRLKEN